MFASEQSMITIVIMKLKTKFEVSILKNVDPLIGISIDEEDNGL